MYCLTELHQFKSNSITKDKLPLLTDSKRQWKLTSLKFQMNCLWTKKTRTILVCFGRDISKDSSSQQNWGLSPDNTDIWSLYVKKNEVGSQSLMQSRAFGRLVWAFALWLNIQDIQRWETPNPWWTNSYLTPAGWDCLHGETDTCGL